jgi:hypothetical protein
MSLASGAGGHARAPFALEAQASPPEVLPSNAEVISLLEIRVRGIAGATCTCWEQSIGHLANA